ncbi:MAG: THUMP domain-containing class I SAM-dependent RNA methyltransferase [Byssovorax sp.]
MAEKGYNPPHEKSPPETRLFATAARGTEGALRDELRELGFRNVRAERGGAHFAGELSEGARACLELRTAMRVLYRLETFPAPLGNALYEGIKAIDWSPYLTAQHTLAVRAVCRDSRITHSQFVAQKTKDAVVDQLRERWGARPSVDRADPDLALFVHLVRDVATVYLDLAGESLHRRGYRAQAMEAPLKESLAAAILRLSGWDRERPLLDPMCGSGTIPIEAVLWARRIAPGLLRERFGLERWACHDEGARRGMADLREAAFARILPDCPPIFGSDLDPAAIAVAAENARVAGVKVIWSKKSVAEITPLSPPGMVVTNPPYGERLAGSDELFASMASALLALPGHRVAILAGSPAIARAFHHDATRSLAVYNGDIECRLLLVAPG